MTILDTAMVAAAAADEKKAWDIIILDMQKVSFITDYFLICSGRTAIQTRSIADNIEEKMQEAGVTLLRREGLQDGRWILLDFGDVVAHIFIEEERRFYNLERLWGDATVIEANGQKQEAGTRF